MRIISGSAKGRPLKGVPGTTTRPTADKVKESIFNMIGPYFQGGIFLDLYAGSGAMGIEALSRGMDTAVFTDRERKAVSTIHANLKAAGVEQKAEVYRTDAARALKASVKKDRQFDGIFLDPPYARQQLNKELAYIDEHHLLKSGGFIVAEHSSKFQLEDSFNTFKKERYEKYGDTAVTIFRSDRQEE